MTALVEHPVAVVHDELIEPDQVVGHDVLAIDQTTHRPFHVQWRHDGLEQQERSDWVGLHVHDALRHQQRVVGHERHA
ncbi:hypothetical protein D3C86_1446880 [compost metagenome]